MPVTLSTFQQSQRLSAIKSFAIQGIGANKTIARLKEMGLPIRRQAGLALYRSYAGVPEKADTLKYIPKGKSPAKTSYTEPEGEAFFRQPYRYTVKFETYNTKTGETKTMYNSMSSMRARTVGEIEAEAWNVFGQKLKDYNVAISSLNLFIAEHERGAAWD